MSLANWQFRHHLPGQQGRKYNFKSKNKSREEELFTSCLMQDPHECFRTILSKLFEKDLEESIILSYLNLFVRFLYHYENNFDTIQFSRKDLLYCLRIALLHESTVIRSAGLRSIRHILKNENDIVNVNKLQLPFLVTRSLDLVQKNDVERIEAIKLIRKILILTPNLLHISMVRALVSLANEGIEGKDRLLRVSLATLSEIGLSNPNLFIEAGGVTAIIGNLIDCQIPKISEALCGILLLLLDHPKTRIKSAIDLHVVAAPFCDFQSKHGWKNQYRRDEKEMRLNCSKLTLLTILKSWPGTFHFCNPKDQGGFKAIVDILYLNQLEVRKATLDLLYDLLELQQPEWTDELSVALSAIDPCDPQSSWRLKEGFVAAEGRAVLPHLAKTTPSPNEMHLAFLLQVFLECGLLGALTEVIVTSDTFISVRATVLLGELLRLTQLFLPPGCCNLSPSLPTLLDYATKSKPQAMAAITALQQFHKLMKKRPATYSLYLDYLFRNSKTGKEAICKKDRSARYKGLKSKLHQVKAVLKDGDDIVKETGVLTSNDALKWNWGLIKIILKGELYSKIDINDASHKLFIKRLLDFFTPSQNKYSHMDLGASPTDSIDLTTSGIELTNYLIQLEQPDYQHMVLDLFKDIQAQIKAITSSRSVHDCLFSPSHMVNTHCQSYFLFIGQFARSVPGMWMLNSIEMFTILKEIAITTHHDIYVKLIISSLDYSKPGPARAILEAVLTCDVESSRLYATQFVLVLLRVETPNFASWAVSLLVTQLRDKSNKVTLSALSTLHEACELPDCLEALIDLNPNLQKIGEKGELLAIKLLSTETGYQLFEKHKIVEIKRRWDEYMNYRYIKIVEGRISDSLTLHQRDEDGKYERSVSAVGNRNNNRKEVFLPPHLYGQLNQHTEGFELLMSNNVINNMVELVRQGKCTTDEQIMKLKAAIWAVSHFSTSNRSISFLNTLRFIEYLIKLAISSRVYSIRSTAFYALGLVATTSAGADELCLNGWLATRRNRHDYWPVIQDELLDTYYLSYFNASISGDADLLSHLGGNDFYGTHDDDTTLSEEGEERLIEYPSSPTITPDIRKIKQWTLPANRTPPEIFHKRSLSESKAFDGGSNGFEEHKFSPNDNVHTRQRNSSMTESTTSGVSSSDSLHNRQGGGTNYLQTLSPIPSSTSLSILKLPQQLKRHSNRVSSNSAGSEASTSSYSGSISNELSLQNMLGYRTIRFIRRKDSLNFYRTERDDYLFKPPPPQTNQTSFVNDNSVNQEPSATVHYSHFSNQKYDPKFYRSENYKPKDTVYIGICLPKNIADIFPDDTPIEYDNTIPTSSSSSSAPIFPLSKYQEASSPVNWKHNKDCCMFCSQMQLSPATIEFDDPIKIDVIKISERLSNPVLCKPYKNQLFRLKQKDPNIFKDICLYSEVCKLCSEANYTLQTRRTLHELFIDVVYEKLYDIPKKLLGLDDTTQKSARKSTGDIKISPTEFISIDSLKLISTENKFPIRIRKNTN